MLVTVTLGPLGPLQGSATQLTQGHGLLGHGLQGSTTGKSKPVTWGPAIEMGLLGHIAGHKTASDLLASLLWAWPHTIQKL